MYHGWVGSACERRGGETVISVYAEKKLQSSFGGVPYAIAAAIFLVIGVSAFVSFLASALGAGSSGYDMDDGVVALVAFVFPGAYFAYRWRVERAKRNLFKSYVFAIDDVETPLIDLAVLVGRSLNETDCDLRELIGEGWYPGAYVDRESYLFVRSPETEAQALGSQGSLSVVADASMAGNAPRRANVRKIVKPLDPEIADIVLQCPQCGELNYRTPELEACEFCGADLRGL